MNLGQLKDALSRKTGVAMDPAAQGAWINEAVQVVSQERDWPWLDALSTVTTTSGTAAYDLPSDWKRTRSVTYNGYPAKEIDVADGDTFLSTFDDFQAITHYTIENGQLVFYPTPADSVTTILHRYVAQEPELAADVNSPSMPAMFDNVIIAYASARVMDRQGDKRAAQFDLEYVRGLQRMKEAMGRNQQPHRVRVRAGGML